MFTTPLVVFMASLSLMGVNGQFDAVHNATGLAGTWSSGSRAVQTGAGFVNPSQKTFTYAKNTGISYSFTDDGHYEVARYRFAGNGSEPNCITGIVNWHHGTYQLLQNGSMVLTPFGDGFQQIQDPCAAVSNFMEDYNTTELYQQWRIFMDPNDGPKLHLFQYDGAPLNPQFRVSQTPIMLPTRMLRNVTKPVPQGSVPGLTVQNALVTGAGVGDASLINSGLVLGLGAVLSLSTLLTWI